MQIEIFLVDINNIDGSLIFTIVSFLGDPYHAYYEYKVNEIRDGKSAPEPEPGNSSNSKS